MEHLEAVVSNPVRLRMLRHGVGKRKLRPARGTMAWSESAGGLI